MEKLTHTELVQFETYYRNLQDSDAVARCNAALRRAVDNKVFHYSNPSERFLQRLNIALGDVARRGLGKKVNTRLQDFYDHGLTLKS